MLCTDSIVTMSGGHISSSVSGDVPAGLFLGGCPVCLRSVVYADSALLDSERAVLLEPIGPARVVPRAGRTVVVVSVVGRPQVVEPWVYRLHACPPGVITESIGFYSPPVLSQTCPVVLCHSQPGELCVSTRHEVLLRPHGSRVMLAFSPALDDSEG